MSSTSLGALDGDATPPLDLVRGTRRIVSVMGTVFTVDLRDMDPGDPAVDEVVAWWRWVDATFSTYRPDSQLSQLAKGSLPLADCSPEVAHVLDLCDRASAASSGYFTSRPVGKLDPSGMVKGWSVEEVSARLRRMGSSQHCITAGGDVRCTGTPGPGDRWRVGIVDPALTGHLLAVVDGGTRLPSELAVATSGTAERGHHILDPHTNLAPVDLAAITVVGSNLETVDWMATAAFAMGHDARAWLEAKPEVEAYAVRVDGDFWYTHGFEDIATILDTPADPTAERGSHI